MGVTLLSRNGEQLSALLVQPETCVAYSLPSLHGYLEALYIP
jgi:hypothetical protein